MKNHIKRIASPKTWVVARKVNKFILRPSPGAHIFDHGLPLGVILRDRLKLASTMNEGKKLLNNNIVLVDGKRRKDHRFIVGLFDILTFPTLKKYYRVISDQKGRIIVRAIPETESGFKLCKVVGKTILRRGRIQFNLHDGKNILSNQKANVGDTLVLSLPKLEVNEVLPLATNAVVFLTKGKHTGGVGELKEIRGSEAIYKAGNKEIETAKEYIFVIGKDKPIIEIENRVI